jgi:alkylhydroperoxidase/carboxymuconolactone decarboxylase family protein YurZ
MTTKASRASMKAPVGASGRSARTASKPDVEARAPGAPARPAPEHVNEGDDDWVFPFERYYHAVVPGVHEAQNAWLSEIDSLRAPDRKTHELIRLVCTVILGNRPGVERHAMLAAEVGATWEEVAGSMVLTEPAFGLLRVVEALPWARRGWEEGRRSIGKAPRD